MAYNDLETSQVGGQPVELFIINTGVNVYRYCNHTEEVLHRSMTFTPISIKRSNLVSTYKNEGHGIDVFMPHDTPAVQHFKTGTPETLPTITIYRAHMVDGDTNIPNENGIVFFSGKVQSSAFSDIECKLMCSSTSANLSQIGLRRKYSANCCHVHYRDACGLDREDFQQLATVVVNNGDVLTMSTLGKDADYYKAGIAQFGGQYRMITAHNGDNITLLAPFENLNTGDPILLAAGCDRTRESCKYKFNNLQRFGGWGYIPTINYFETGII